jgi:maltose alpha-D-glucosyltransferase/alpha-amylase
MRAPAARDVAGLIRSIDYSVSAARQRALKLGSDDDGRLETALARWRDQSIATFLDSYREAMTDPRLWPTDRTAADNLLRFFLLEKAFYEIEYELSHRPDWVRVALAGALRVLQEGEAR